MLTIGEIIATVLAGGGFWTLIQSLINYKVAKDSTEKQALKSLLRDAIYKRCEVALRNGSISVKELENIEGLYDPYKKLGGNGTAKKLVDEVKEMHTEVSE